MPGNSPDGFLDDNGIPLSFGTFPGNTLDHHTLMPAMERTVDSLGPDFGKDLNWTYGIHGARISKALREWQVNELPGEYYQMQNASDGDITTLFKAFGISVPAKIYTKGDIRELKSAISPFCYVTQ